MSSDNANRRVISRVLVANRGEIARRIIRTAHDMGIDTVAVFADGDADLPFVAEAGHAIALGGSSAAETYLDVDKLLAAAASAGADAVHPGYGFLAENASFAQAVIDAGLTWVGPAPATIAAMGDKLKAKELMVEAGVPTLPSIEVSDGLDLSAAATEIGFPILVKAAAGGGGKGMRVVGEAADLVDAIGSAQREALAGFGDSTVFLEKYVPVARHVEVQVIGDQHGNLVHLFERECSIQRRHQKVIEEAPSPALAAPVRDEMTKAALAAAQAIDYVSAGTVEFLLAGDGDDADFWFLEVNTRIQVEHPVTEEVTGVDLIREQLRVAAGEPLSISQDELRIEGHAIEARLYAEDPANDFLPATGTLVSFEPPTSPAARLEAGVVSGSVVGVEFDPMIAKVIVHAPTRQEAASRLALVMERTMIAGVQTNRDFLVATLRSPAFLEGDTTTDFIERVGVGGSVEVADEQLAQSALVATMYALEEAKIAARPLSFMPAGYRNASMPAERSTFQHGERTLEVQYRWQRTGGYRVDVLLDGEPASASSVRVVDFVPAGGDESRGHASGSITLVRGADRSSHRVASADGQVFVTTSTGTVVLDEVARFPDTSAVDVAGGQTAPMPGKVVAVHVAVDDQLVAGQPLVVMEAMKMEHTITAPGDGVVVEVRCAPGDQVDNGQVLVVIESAAEPDS